MSIEKIKEEVGVAQSRLDEVSTAVGPTKERLKAQDPNAVVTAIGEAVALLMSMQDPDTTSGFSSIQTSAQFIASQGMQVATTEAIEGTNNPHAQAIQQGGLDIHDYGQILDFYGGWMEKKATEALAALEEAKSKMKEYATLRREATESTNRIEAAHARAATGATAYLEQI